MPTYHYKCNNCTHEFEISQSIKEKSKKKCPECLKLSLERVLYPAYGRVARTSNDMKTVGDLAKLNTDKMSKMEKQDKDHKYASSSKLAKHKLEAESKSKAWWHEGMNHPTQKLKKATPKQIEKYIKGGETPD